MQRIKILGLLAIAAMVTVAFVGATSASAAKFTSSKVGAALSGTTLKNYVGTVTGSSSSCNKISAEGVTGALESESANGFVAVSECTFAGFPATVTINKCGFTVYAGGKGEMTGSECEVIAVVNNVFAKCKGVAKPQTLTSAASFSNGSGDIVAKAAHSGVTVEVTESSGLCPLTVGKHTNASFSGESTVKAEGTTVAWDS
jgi:hypothetical protein